MAGRKVFTSGEILTAADVNSFLMNQVVAVFADDDARSSAIPSPTEGMVTYVEDSNRVEVFDGSAFGPIGAISQIVRATFTTDVTTTSEIYVDTGMSISITPKSASSIIYVISNFNADNEDATGPAGNMLIQLTNSSDVPLLGAEESNLGIIAISSSRVAIKTQIHLIGSDSPASTSEQTYKLRFKQSSSTLVEIQNSQNTGQLLAVEVTA